MKKVAVLSTVFALLLSLSFVLADDKKDEKPKDDKKIELKGIKCPVSGAAVKEASTRDYKGGKVFFCCDNCPKKFDMTIKTDKVLAEKSNLQLVSTKQAQQTKCPIKGTAINKEKSEKIAGVEVFFCCDGCKGKVASAKDDAAKIDLVFNDKSFDKAFKVKGAKATKGKKRDKEN